MDKLKMYWLSYIYGRVRQYVQPYINTEFMVNEIIDNVYLGDFASACNKEQLKNLGITHIITVVRGMEEMFPDDFNYLLLDIGDNYDNNISQYFDKCNNFIDKALENNGKVYIHCMYGISRSATIMCAYLLHSKNMSVTEGLNHIKSIRPIINPNHGFINQLKEKYD